MIEEAYIDKYASAGDMQGTISSVNRLNMLTAYCMEFVLFHPDTALIVTADHKTGTLTKEQKGFFAHPTLHQWKRTRNCVSFSIGGGEAVKTEHPIVG